MFSSAHVVTRFAFYYQPVSDRDMKCISNLENEQVRPWAAVTMLEVTLLFCWPSAHPWNGAAPKLISVLGGFSVLSLLILPPQEYCSYFALRNSMCNSQK